MTGPRDILLTTEPLAPPSPRFTEAAGGVVDFYGVVRGHEGAETISGIDYEAHRSMASHQLELLVEEACEKFPLLGLTLHHRIGFVAAAEASLFLRVSAAHRGPAFEAAEWLIVELKRRVPIWKHPVSRATGTMLAFGPDDLPAAPAQTPGETSPDAVA